MATKAKKQTEQPTKAQLEKLRQADDGYALANQDAVKFLHSRKKAVFNISRRYHLEPDELLQEGYEVLLTCLRDFSPIYVKNDGETVSVQFTTFFGSRMENRAMELRNRNPEYQARQAYTSDMPAEEKNRFRQDPPLLVQHLDQETPLQEALRSEASEMRDATSGDTALKIARDSFFEQKLNELVAQERDEKKRAALMHVKIGGVFNFQEMAYHFGVTDSRASQILNDLMDAFYVQRLIDGNLSSVAYDFKKLKFNEKRATRLLAEAISNSSLERSLDIMLEFKGGYPVVETFKSKQKVITSADGSAPEAINEELPTKLTEPKEFMLEKENVKFPLIALEMRPLNQLKAIELSFRPLDAEDSKNTLYIAEILDRKPEKFPLLINESGQIIDGVRRLEEAKKRGISSIMCMIRHIPEDHDIKVMRVAANIRQSNPNKTDLYFAIVALSNLGLSQQKIAVALGTSRTNVIVYTKVKDKATPAIRKLFEDGLIQITNASSCVDLSSKMQDKIAEFISKFGAMWGKGSKFAEVLASATNGKLAKLEKRLIESQPSLAIESVIENSKNLPAEVSQTVSKLTENINSYQQALKDSEVWNAQRESVINRQTEELTEAQSEIESLKKELNAAELTKFGDESTIKEALKELKAFYSLTERMSSALHNTKQAAKQVRKQPITRNQLRELHELMDSLEQHTNALRLELASKTGL